MRKVIVEMFIPAANQTVDIFLPELLPLREAVKMAGKAASDISDGLFQSDGDTVICRRADGAILNGNLTVYELKIKNGARLMLV
jgi:hypothetical protein